MYTDLTGLRINGVPIFGDSGPDISGQHYFVQGNGGSDSNDGSSWDEPFLTVTKAIAINNEDIARTNQWAHRNTINISGDSFDEDLVVFPNKCDVRGWGSVDGFHYAGILGNHVPVNTNPGTAFYNIRLLTEAAGPIVTIAGSTSSGVEFHHCLFDAHNTNKATIGIESTGSIFLKVINCDFIGAFSTSFISFLAGAIDGTQIMYNNMTGGAAAGILANNTSITAQSGRKGIIRGNFIQCVAKCITTETVSDFYVVDNRGISDGSSGTNSWDVDDTFQVGNIVNGAGTVINEPTTTD